MNWSSLIPLFVFVLGWGFLGWGNAERAVFVNGRAAIIFADSFCVEVIPHLAKRKTTTNNMNTGRGVNNSKYQMHERSEV
jgi:hypothetical protein